MLDVAVHGSGGSGRQTEQISGRIPPESADSKQALLGSEMSASLCLSPGLPRAADHAPAVRFDTGTVESQLCDNGGSKQLVWNQSHNCGEMCLVFLGASVGRTCLGLFFTALSLFPNRRHARYVVSGACRKEPKEGVSGARRNRESERFKETDTDLVLLDSAYPLP